MKTNKFLCIMLVTLNHGLFQIIKSIAHPPRCTGSGLKQITCPSGLAFDIEKQTCDWKAKVDNCNKKESKSQNMSTLNQQTLKKKKKTSYSPTLH